MHFKLRYAFGLLIAAASCGQILDADGDYRPAPESAGGAGGSNAASTSSMASTGGGAGMGGMSTGGMGGTGGGMTVGCGNMTVEMDEQCDDGNLQDGDGCDSNCTVTKCGNAIQTSPEQCDDGNGIEGDGCDSNCTVSTCGNGIMAAMEECDDGNTMNGDGCSGACNIESMCGNGVVEAGEECDDNNLSNGDGCDSNCTPTNCGNGIKTMGEECDDGNMVNNDACMNDCRQTPASCVGLAENCGPLLNENCCKSNAVSGGAYDRLNNTSYPASVSAFRLDRFEVTVGRFRKFVEAYPQSKPMANAGAHPLIAQTGWSDAWNSNLAADQAALRTAIACSMYTAWSDAAATKENMPMNCMKWYEAFAFCAWDGGRLPTEAEWNYAAAAGKEQRYYPWSNPPASTTIDPTYANYNCYGDGSAAQDCKIADILSVGSKSPKGDGAAGFADLVGSMREWLFDVHAALPTPCNDCANLTGSTDRVVRGGGWQSGSGLSSNEYRDMEPPATRSNAVGFRCARGL